MFDTPDYEQSDSNMLSKKRKKKHKIEHLDVYVYSFDQSLNLDTDESYTLTVGPIRHLTAFMCNVIHRTYVHSLAKPYRTTYTNSPTCR